MGKNGWEKQMGKNESSPEKNNIGEKLKKASLTCGLRLFCMSNCK